MSAQPHTATSPLAILAEYRSLQQPTATETALPSAARWRASVIGLGLGALALAAATAGGLLIVTGPLHTSLGGIA